MKTILASLFALASLQAVPGAAAQAYPVKPIRFLVGFPPGGGTDIMARVVTAKLTESVGQQVIVDNRPGANANLAAGIASRAMPDGYTVLMISLAHAVSKPLYRKLDYDLERDFTPLINIASVPMFVVVPPASAVKSLAELLALARAKPVNYASSGDGSPEHIAAELFKGLAKIEMTHVPYKGGGPSALALTSGEIQVGFNTAPVAVPHIRSGKMRALAVSSAKRNPALPEVPTVAEAGVPGYDIILWYGAVMPTGTPAAIVNRLNADINKALKLPDVQQRLAALGADPLGGTPAEFGAYIKAEVAKYTRVVREAKLQQQ
ncbi:MAG: Bug family tripartite tricarboxylate transporter substrate binding protein [Betaproteobacteria bacterium]|jgi:tripartite-type tricarboxylate transporter receptor subunit TctC|nr:tripartite tricarboxylate transporter substrate binding protein [Betaproteobacteria bacterium]